MPRAPRIGELLVAADLLTEAQLSEVLDRQAERGTRFGTLLVELGYVSEIDLTQILSRQLSVAWVSLTHVDFTAELLSLVPYEVADSLLLIPVHFRVSRDKHKILYVAMDDPTNIAAMEQVARVTRMHVRPLIAPPSDIRRAIDEHYRRPAG